MRRILRHLIVAAVMLAVALGVVAVLKDDPGYEAGRSEISGKIVGLTEYQEGRDRTEASVPARDGAPAATEESRPASASAPFDNRPASVETVPAAGKVQEDAPAGRKSGEAAARREEKEEPRREEPAPAPEARPAEKEKAVQESAASRDAGERRPAEEKAAARDGAKTYEREVTSAKFAMKGSQIKLILQGNAPMVGHYSTLGDPDRVVLDLAGNWDIEVPRVPSNRLIQGVRVGHHEDKTRIVLDMKTMGRVALVPLSRNSLELCIQ